MGREIDATAFTLEDRTRYREKLKADLEALRRILPEASHSTDPLIGLELELYLTDHDAAPAPINDRLLDSLPSGLFQAELATYNGEVDLAPRPFSRAVLGELAEELREALARVDAEAATLDAQLLLIGILPTLTEQHVTEDKLSSNPRYRALNDAIVGARGEAIQIHIEGEETLRTASTAILFEAACTSLQLHLQIDPSDFARYWNAAQALLGPLLAVAANSPFFLGRALHHETRIALFTQAIDTRSEELQAQGVRPRVWFGERWLAKGALELFEENVRYFPALLPIVDEEDPFAVLAAGGTPRLSELALHNGTVYRWNRPVYDVGDGRPSLRIENRVLPAGPTVVDVIANAALFYGLVRALADGDPPIWQRMSFDVARENFTEVARHGLDARLYWPGIGAEVPAGELLVRTLLPLASAGLRAWGLDDREVDYHLGIIEHRALTGQNGAVWQRETHRALRRQGLGPDEAATELVRRYRKQAATGEPVHTWPR